MDGAAPRSEFRTATGGTLYPYQPGVSGNPGGRPKVARPPSQALAELNDTPGATPDEVVEKFKAARGEKLCAADHKAIAQFLRESNPKALNGVAAFDSVTDRLEGKVRQDVRQENVGALRLIVDEIEGTEQHPEDHAE